MTDYRNFEANRRPAAIEPRSSEAARQTAVAVVRDISDKLDHTVLETLRAAALDPIPGKAKEALLRVLADGVDADQIADYYVPVIAREMGDRWCEDNLSFAAVTIGASRLQFMLRELGTNWADNKTVSPDAPTILLIVPKVAYHTLGAVVLSGQLRRQGLSVKLVLGDDTKDIARRVARTHYNAVFISSARGQALESLRQIVDVVKASAKERTPVVIGGTILDIETSENVTALTGATFATKIPQEALRLCGLLNPSQEIASTKLRT
jgi:methylmalonyl-CoA mutase cobalamin-binding subunit